MTGYFSQLAHHTGLSFEPGATMTARRFAKEPIVVAEPPERAPSVPPHVEEITFTPASAPIAVEGDTEDLAAASSLDANPFPRTSWVEGGIAFTTSESETRKPPEPSAEAQAHAIEPPVVQPHERSDAELQPAAGESIKIPHESSEMVESPFAARSPRAQSPRTQTSHTPRPEVKDSDQPRATGDLEPADVLRDESLERGLIVQHYLKEVRAWVASPPEFDERELERQRDTERPLAENRAEISQVGHNKPLTLKREVQLTDARAGPPGALEVQDLKLSIGTISIVIEEPKQAIPGTLSASPRMDRSPERPASEPTRLSRYYLGRW